LPGNEHRGCRGFAIVTRWDGGEHLPEGVLGTAVSGRRGANPSTGLARGCAPTTVEPLGGRAVMWPRRAVGKCGPRTCSSERPWATAVNGRRRATHPPAWPEAAPRRPGNRQARRAALPPRRAVGNAGQPGVAPLPGTASRRRGTGHGLCWRLERERRCDQAACCQGGGRPGAETVLGPGGWRR
jgi:hypothetical protein